MLVSIEMEVKKKFGLVLPKKTGTLTLKGKSVFDDNSDVETSENSSRPKIPQSKAKVSIDKTSVEDPSIYEYDSVYDEMKAQEISERAPKEKQSSRYIDSLLKAADKRKKEYERRVERKIQVEREKEGDKFKDKESFVTSSYKKKMQEMEDEEERERRENEINEMMDVTKQKDLSGFYRHFLKQTVGEEKIPIYGETRNIKKEVLSDSEIEISNVEKSECVTDFSEKKPSKMKTEINCDSDSLSSNSSSEENDNPDSNKIQRKLSKVIHSKKRSNIDDEASFQKTSIAHSYTKRKYRTKTDSGTLDNACKKQKQCSSSEKEEITDSSDKSTHENEATQPSETVTAVSALKDISSNIQKESSHKVKQKSQNIFVKRTVGAVFDEAQARYFKRMAERDSNL